MWPGLPLRVFSNQICFLVDLCVYGKLWKIVCICVFWSDKLISNISAFNNIKITVHHSVHMRTSGEKIRISDEVERVQSVSYSPIRSLPGLYTVLCLTEGKRGTCLGPPLQLLCVKCLAFKGAQQQLSCISSLLCFQRGLQQQLQCGYTLLSKGPKVIVMHKHFSFQGPPNFTVF